jgi:hypothetical protein
MDDFVVFLVDGTKVKIQSSRFARASQVTAQVCEKIGLVDPKLLFGLAHVTPSK